MGEIHAGAAKNFPIHAGAVHAGAPGVRWENRRKLSSIHAGAARNFPIHAGAVHAGAETLRYTMM